MKNLDGNDTPVIPDLIRDPRRVLLLALSGIGNLIMQLPTIEALKKAHPNWNVTVWVAPRGTKAIAESQSYIDDVIEMPVSPPYQGGAGGGLVQHVKNVATLRKQHFDIGIVLSPGQLVKGAAYLKLAGIPIRIGNTYPHNNNPASSRFLTHAVDELSAMHDIEQNLRLLEPLGIHPEPVPCYSLQIPKENVQEASTLYPLLSTVSYIGIHAGCAKGFEFKRWPLERFAEVAKALLQKNPNIKFLIFGGKDEESQKQELTNTINSICHPGLDPGSTKSDDVDSRFRGNDTMCATAISAPILTTAALIQHCNLFISNDSGLMHIAAAVGVPTIGLFGPTDERLTGPRGPKSAVVRAEGTTAVYSTEKVASFGSTSHTSLLAITPQMIIDKVVEMNVL